MPVRHPVDIWHEEAIRAASRAYEAEAKGEPSFSFWERAHKLESLAANDLCPRPDNASLRSALFLSAASFALKDLKPIEAEKLALKGLHTGIIPEHIESDLLQVLHFAL